MSKKRQTVQPSGLTLELKFKSTSRDEIAALPVTQKADLAYAMFGKLADMLTDTCGIDHDLVADAALDLGFELRRIDGTPFPRVVRIDPRGIGHEPNKKL